MTDPYAHRYRANIIEGLKILADMDQHKEDPHYNYLDGYSQSFDLPHFQDATLAKKWRQEFLATSSLSEKEYDTLAEFHEAYRSALPLLLADNTRLTDPENSVNLINLVNKAEATLQTLGWDKISYDDLAQMRDK